MPENPADLWINITAPDDEEREDELIEFASDKITFNTMNLTTDSLPKYDLVFVRDCLVHLSYTDTKKALSNTIDSRSRYLLTTSFVDRERNFNIASSEWRPINLEKQPYDFRVAGHACQFVLLCVCLAI